MKKKIYFAGLMDEFKLNSNKKVMDRNRDIIRPDVGATEIYPRSVSFTDSDRKKLDKLRAKYKISRSAIIRILLANVEV